MFSHSISRRSAKDHSQIRPTCFPELESLLNFGLNRRLAWLDGQHAENSSTFSLLPRCLSAATSSHYARVDAAPAAAPHIRPGMHAVIITRPSPAPYSSPLATAIIPAKQLKLIHFFGGGKSAACNDTNCPDLNAVIGPLGALERKWLQLRLFHFLATRARAYNLKGETLCITCAPQLEMQPNECM